MVLALGAAASFVPANPLQAAIDCVSQVPVMTGNTSPSGTVTTSGFYALSYDAWHAFDGSGSGWISEAFETPAWIAYEWTSSRRILRYSLLFNNGGLTSRAPKDWELQGWNGSSWITVDARSGQTGWAGTETRTYDVASPGNYNKYRLYFLDDNDSRTGVVTISLGEISFATCSCSFSASQVPTMTSDSAPSGLVSTSGTYSGSYPAWHAFDAANTLWISAVNQTPAWIGYEWPSSRLIDYYTLSFNNTGLTSRAPKDWTLQGWNGSSWVILDTRTNQVGWLGTETRGYTVASPAIYGKYRLNFTDDNDIASGVVVISLGGIVFEGCHD